MWRRLTADRRAALAVAGALVVAVTVASRPADGFVSGQDAPAVERQVERYALAIERYRSGQADAQSVLTDLGLDAAQRAVARLVVDVEKDVAAGRPTRWAVADLQAAVLFHTEVLLRGLAELPSEQSRHLDLARRLATLPAGRQRLLLPAPFRRQWLLLMAWRAHDGLDLDEVGERLAELRRQFPEDGDVLLLAGSLEETYAWPGLDASRPRSALRAAINPPSRGSRLRAAEARFRQALRITPDLHEARLRLGRVLAERGLHTAAFDLLAGVFDVPDDPWVSYLARLFAGASSEGLGRVEDTVGHYRAAVSICPEAQTARVALAHALWRRGAVAEAREAAISAAAVHAGDPDDPWWGYYLGQAHRLEAVFGQMRAEVLR